MLLRFKWLHSAQIRRIMETLKTKNHHNHPAANHRLEIRLSYVTIVNEYKDGVMHCHNVYPGILTIDTTPDNRDDVFNEDIVSVLFSNANARPSKRLPARLLPRTPSCTY